MKTKDKIISAIKEQMEETKGNLGPSERSKSDLVLGLDLALSIVKNAFKEEDTRQQEIEKIMAEVEEKARAFTEAHKDETSEEILKVCRGEFLEDKSEDDIEIDWENRRFQIATTILPYCAETARTHPSNVIKSFEEDAAISAVDYADALIEILKTTEP